MSAGRLQPVIPTPRPIRSWLRARRGAVARLAAALLVGALFSTGALRWLDSAVGDLRFSLWNREPTGSIVLVDIDEASIAAIGKWPWSRTVHARIIDALRNLNADSIAFDVDFSSRATPDGDAALEAALKRADGSVILAALQQPRDYNDRSGTLVPSHPLPRFAANGWEASVLMSPDPDGRVRSMTRTDEVGGAPLPTLSTLLAAVASAADWPFNIDYGILASRLPHVSAIDLLDGRVGRAAIAGRKALVGATALELRDYVEVPRFGSIPGSYLHALAAESLLQGRALRPVGLWLTLILAACCLAGAAVPAGRLRLPAHFLLLAGTAVAAEAAAVGVQTALPIMPSTAPIHATLALFALIAVAIEIDERRVKIVRSRSEADRLRVILDRVIADNFAGIVVIDHDGVVRAISAAASAILGLPAAAAARWFGDVLPPPLSAAIGGALAEAQAGPQPSERAWTVDCETGSGARIVLECRTTVSRVPGPVGSDGRIEADRFAVCLSFEDVTEKRAAEARLSAMARIDALTGLANRRVLIEGIEAALDRSSRHQAPCAALLFFDLDRFKIVNDRLGHASGDLLLSAVADRLRRLVVPGDLAARLGGDEFALLIERASADEALRFAEQVVATVGGTYEIGPYQASLGVSAGLATAAGGDSKTLMRDADIALTEARAEGGDRLAHFDAALARVAEDGRALEQDLREALLREEFEVFYQRQVDLASGAIVGVEALVRWRHPRNGFVSPTKFIPAAERTGLIEPLGAWVMRTACRDAASWPVPIKVSVNLSAVQLSRGDLVGTVLEALRDADLAPERLDLELTESMLMENDELARGLLARLRAAGVRLSLDDFGTGYSSLSYLRTFAVDKIKLDQSFVRDLPEDRSSIAIISAVVGMAGGLGLRVNAEGVETAQQMDLLRRLGCDEVQGYLHGRPERAPAIVASLIAQRDRARAVALV